ncbi:MAG: hypothetical protein IJZ29_02435 [Clostridia bacterium]|nr:hypothetical protein [Clostridia bacterium]
MKKFLICLVFLISFATLSSAFLVAGGFDGNKKMLKAETFSFKELTKEEKELVEAELDNIVSNKGKNDVIFDIVLFETSDFEGYFKESRINYLQSLFNDNDNSNYDFSVHEYFESITYGQVSIYANFYLYKDSKPRSYYEPSLQNNAINEYATYTRAKLKAETISKEYGSGNAQMIIFPGLEPDSNENRLWAHATLDASFVSLTYGACDIGTICHEILHTFGLPDYYTHTDSNTPVDSWDILANSTDLSNTLMYNKLNVGWVDISNYNDNEATEIETITESGRYTLHPTAENNGTLAYKFGMKQGNEKVYFMVEYRVEQDDIDTFLYQDGLVVYRVNENYKKCGNVTASYETNELYVYRKYDSSSPDDFGLNEGDTCGKLTNEYYHLYYEDDTVAKFIIDNIEENADGTISFDFTNLQNVNVVAGKVINDYKSVANAIVSVNGVERTTTNADGEFIIENFNVSNVISVRDSKGELTFLPVTAEPNTYNLKIYAKQEKNLKIIVREGKADNIYTIYKQNGSNWIYIGKFAGDEDFYLTAYSGEKYKVDGYCVDNKEFTVGLNTIISITQIPPSKQEESKSASQKIVDTITNIPNKIANALGNAYNSLKESIGNAFTQLGNLFD